MSDASFDDGRMARADCACQAQQADKTGSPTARSKERSAFLNDNAGSRDDTENERTLPARPSVGALERTASPAARPEASLQSKDG